MTSIRRGDAISADDYYLSSCVNQARLALYHLDRLWAIEGTPADLTVWHERRTLGDLPVWAELQGFVTAAIILNRFLKPKPIPPKGATGPRKAELKSQASKRAKRLRELLEVEDDSPLFTIEAVRHSYEHIDERIDALVTAGDVWSLSDWYISEDLYLLSVSEIEARSQGQEGRHENVRYFAPFVGLLVFGEDEIDLFQVEAALHELLAVSVGATQKIVGEYPPGRAAIGTFKPQLWQPDLWQRRRQQVEEMREIYRQDGRSRMVLKTELSTVDILVPRITAAADEQDAVPR
ncbi:hypothetical protein ACFT1B_33520 [Streptomyces griseoincarnatus]|uniref:hypothetical protein n=1 Tax=Promicromonospora sp. NPDC057138 TaxID=3346031 RepID=UPI0036293E14